jgi:hypothetical protein
MTLLPFYALLARTETTLLILTVKVLKLVTALPLNNCQYLTGVGRQKLT